MTPFLAAFFLVFIAEIGDKTQLVAMAFATRYSASVVIGGVLGATLLIQLGSVLLGAVVGFVLPIFWVKLVAGSGFIAVGMWTLRKDDPSDPMEAGMKRWSPMATVTLTFLCTEIGDKTMLATITLASQYQAFISVWLGSTMGMILADGLGVGIGRAIGARLPGTILRYGAAGIFGVTGITILLETLAR